MKEQYTLNCRVDRLNNGMLHATITRLVPGIGTTRWEMFFDDAEYAKFIKDLQTINENQTISFSLNDNK